MRWKSHLSYLNSGYFDKYAYEKNGLIEEYQIPPAVCSATARIIKQK